MISKRCINPKGGVKDAPSAHFDVILSSPQCDMLKPTSLELNKRDIMKYAGGHVATIKMAAWKLDQLQYVKVHSLLCCKQLSSIGEAYKPVAVCKFTGHH
jgi:hypothetical protein